jgi:hypothetical protein
MVIHSLSSRAVPRGTISSPQENQKTASALPRRGRFLLDWWGIPARARQFQSTLYEPDIGFIIVVIIDLSSAVIDD